MPKLEEIFELLKNFRMEGVDTERLLGGLIKDVFLEGKKLSFTLLIPPSLRKKKEALRDALTSYLLGAHGISSVSIETKEIQEEKRTVKKILRKPEKVKKILVVSSGKGGVGKSTISANLAIALCKDGSKVGLLDGDVYGPSIPKIMGIEGDVPTVFRDKIIPIKKFGIKALSIGLLVDESTPVIWRGPLVHKAYEQLFFQVNWGELDYLVVDLPPGTGDPQISIAQLVEIDGGIVVTTPQDVALSDVKKAISMLLKTNVPVLGIIENMSYFRCPRCGEVSEIFGKGGGHSLAMEFEIPLLGQLPIDPELATSSDKGIPIVAKKPSSSTSQCFFDIARRIKEKLKDFHGNT